MTRSRIDRYRGAMLGLAAGDALGTTLEFKPPGSFTPSTDMQGGGPFRLAAGAWTDDTSMAPPEIRGTGYVVRSLEAALWAFATTDDFASGALAAVNLGDDADTTGAVYGQLAGAYYGAGGERGVPERWTAKLVHHEAIAGFGERLHLAAGWR